MKTTIDVKRQTRTFYARANVLIRNFRHCTDKVKCYLFQSYCTCMYCSQLWFKSTNDSLRKVRTSYNTVLRRLLCTSLPYSASTVKCLYLEEYPGLINCKSLYNFAKRIERIYIYIYYIYMDICLH